MRYKSQNGPHSSSHVRLSPLAATQFILIIALSPQAVSETLHMHTLSLQAWLCTRDSMAHTLPPRLAPPSSTNAAQRKQMDNALSGHGAGPIACRRDAQSR